MAELGSMSTLVIAFVDCQCSCRDGNCFSNDFQKNQKLKFYHETTKNMPGVHIQNQIIAELTRGNRVKKCFIEYIEIRSTRKSPCVLERLDQIENINEYNHKRITILCTLVTSSEFGNDSPSTGTKMIAGRYFPLNECQIGSIQGFSLPCASRSLFIAEGRNKKNGGTGLNVWDGAVLLVRYLEQEHIEEIKGSTVLELGSGCGVVGIAAALFGAKSVVLTDLQYSLPLMKKNVNANSDAIKAAGCFEIECKTCDWLRPVSLSQLGLNKESLDFIFVADCVWLEELVEPLMQTLEFYCAESNAIIYMSYQRRGKATHDVLLESLNRAFHVEEIQNDSLIPNNMFILRCKKM